MAGDDNLEQLVQLDLEEMRRLHEELERIAREPLPEIDPELLKMPDLPDVTADLAALQRLADELNNGPTIASILGMPAAPPQPKIKATAAEVAHWMLEQLGRRTRLYQAHTAREIHSRFDGAHTYNNSNNNLAISRGVLTVFRALTLDVVWSQSGRYWRRRTPEDPQGRLVR